MSDKKTVSAKVEQSLLDQIDQYADERDLRRSPAIRDLVRAGLDADQSPDSVPLNVAIAWLGSVVAVAGAAGGTGTAGAIATLLGAAAFVGGIGYPYAVQRFD